MITRTRTRFSVTFIHTLAVLCRLNIKVFIIAKEMQQWVPLALLSRYKIFSTAIIMMRIVVTVCVYILTLVSWHANHIFSAPITLSSGCTMF